MHGPSTNTCIMSDLPGEVVGVLHGPNVGKMKAMVREEIFKEQQVVAGNSRRSSISIDEAVPGEQLPSFQCVTNIEFSNEYEYIPVINFGTNTNTNIFIC